VVSQPVVRQSVLSRSVDRRASKAAQKAARQAQKAAAHKAALHKAAVKKAAAKKAAERRQPTASRNAARTVAAAIQATVNAPGLCLQWSREQAGIPSKYSDASTAWKHATGRRAGNANPPRGAAVYWTGGSRGYGHIAISLGNGKVRSTDAGGSGRVATISISQISREWHLKYAGWADSINGYRIPGVAAT